MWSGMTEVVRVTEHEWNGHKVKILKTKAREACEIIEKMESQGESFSGMKEAVDKVCLGVDGKDWLDVLDNDEIRDFAQAAISFFVGKESPTESST